MTPTPRPWISLHHPSDSPGVHRIRCPRGYAVAHVLSRKGTGESDANAALIVKAVNAHEEIVAQLTSLSNMILVRDEAIGFSPVLTIRGLIARVDEARALLARLDA
jgi:hypothetical protein